MPELFYRYVGDDEKEFIEENNMILSYSGETYFTLDRYDSAEEAQQYLALPVRPAWRIGGITAERMPEMDAVAECRVRPMHGQPGGGSECATSEPVYLFGIAKLG